MTLSQGQDHWKWYELVYRQVWKNLPGKFVMSYVKVSHALQLTGQMNEDKENHFHASQ